MLFDRIIIGVNDKKLQLKLLDTKKKTIGELLMECKIFEAASTNKSLLVRNTEPAQNISVINNTPKATTAENTTIRRCFNCGAVFGSDHLKQWTWSQMFFL